MQIKDKMVVGLHYSVSTPDGTEIDTSEGGKPLKFIQGSHFMIQGLEESLYDKSVGDEYSITVTPEKAYGERNDALVQQVPVQMFEGMDVEVGMSFRATTDDGEQSVIIIDKDDTAVTVDGNHPLAGQTLVFDVKVDSVREATETELDHGHVHESDCCEDPSCSNH